MQACAVAINAGRITRKPVRMTPFAPTRPAIYDRFTNLLIAPERVATMLGKRSPGEVAFEESEQNYARRQLLNIEKIAIENKRLQAENDESFVDTVNHSLHETVLTEFNAQMANPAHILSYWLGLADDTFRLLDVLYSRAVTITRMEPHASALPWLYDELMQIVNQPMHRRKDSRGRVIVVESMRTALSFLGIENLRIIIPALVVKRAMPQVTDPYPQIKHRLYDYAQATALSAKQLATFTGQRQNFAYVLGMLSVLGQCAVTKMYFRLFDKVHRELLETSQRERQRDEHDALLKLAPSANYLIALQNEYSDTLTADLFSVMGFRFLPVADAMAEVASQMRSTGASLATILKQARRYAQTRLLHQQRFIDKNELRPFLSPGRYPAGALEALRDIDLTQLPIRAFREN